MDATGNHGPPRFLSRGRLIALAVVALAAAAVVLVWFQPQRLLQDTRVNEAPPGAMERQGDAMERQGDAGAKQDEAMAKQDDAMARQDEAMAMDDAMMIAGTFRSLDHETSGRATLSRADDGNYYVRLEDFATENGPDLFVYLSTAPPTAEGRAFAEDFVDLGPLKGNIGNQNYLVPEAIDLEKYQSVVIWCRRFTTPFGAAPLEAQ